MQMHKIKNLLSYVVSFVKEYLVHIQNVIPLYPVDIILH